MTSAGLAEFVVIVTFPVRAGLARSALPVMSAATRNDEGFPTKG
jgi:hypothetical protein